MDIDEVPNLVFNDNDFRDQNTICRDVLILKEAVYTPFKISLIPPTKDILNRISKYTNLNPKK